MSSRQPNPRPDLPSFWNFLISQLGESLPVINLVTPDPAKVHGLEYAWPQLRIWSSKNSSYLASAAKRGAEIKLLDLPKVKQTSELLERKELQKKLKQGSRVLVFKNLPKVEKICTDQGWQLMMPPATLASQIEDKITFVDFCRQAKLPILPSRIAVLEQVRWDKPIVIQSRRGHAGESTFFVRSAAELDRLKEKIGQWTVKITPLKKLPTLTLNLVVGNSQTYTSQPMYQITGDPRLNPLPGGTGGIDLGLGQSLTSAKTQAAILTLAQQVGQALRETGYLGLAGIDLLVDDAKNQVYLVECNPRLTANLGYLTRLQAAAGEIPLLTLHLLTLLGQDTSRLSLPLQSQVKTGRQEVKRRAL